VSRIAWFWANWHRLIIHNNLPSLSVISPPSTVCSHAGYCNACSVVPVIKKLIIITLPPFATSLLFRRMQTLTYVQPQLSNFDITRNTFCGTWYHSTVALHCCKAHSKSIGKMENSTSCKIVTPENLILKLGTGDYVENITHYTNFHVHRFSGGFSTNRWNITPLWLFSCPVLFFFLDELEPRDRYSRFMAQITWFNPRMVFLWVRTISDIILGKCAQNPKRCVNRHFQAKLAYR